jgi:hypothetical protein
MRQAFSLRIITMAIPRALPWAMMNEPVGLVDDEVGLTDSPSELVAETIGLAEAWAMMEPFRVAKSVIRNSSLVIPWVFG